MSNDSGVYVGPVVIVDVGFEEVESYSENYCVNCKLFCNGKYCNHCGLPLQKKPYQQLRNWRKCLIDEGYSEDFFCNLPIKNKNEVGIVVLGSNGWLHSVSEDYYYGDLRAFDGKTIDRLMKSFHEDCGSAIQSLIENGFKCRVRFVYVVWEYY